MTAITRKDQTNAVEVSTRYFKKSDASGALFNFVQAGSVSSNGSVFLPLDRNVSHNHTLPFYLNPGFYQVRVYDIEYDETLSNGVGYPAAFDELNLTDNVHGKIYTKVLLCRYMLIYLYM